MTTPNHDKRILPVEVVFSPKTYDIDASNHVSNISFIRWLEDLRLVWLQAYHPLEKQAAEGVMPALLRTEIDYIKQIKLFENVVGTIWVQERGKLRWNLHFEFTVNGDVRARAKQVGIWFRPEDGKPVRPPREILTAYETALNADAPKQGERS